MMNDMIRQKMIVRQSSMKLAVELLISEMPNVMIPVDSIKKLTNELEDFVFELDENDNKQLNIFTGEVEEKPPVKEKPKLKMDF